MTGPLDGLHFIELAGIGPVPLAATMLADMGADVVRVDRPLTGDGPADPASAAWSVTDRGRRSISVDLKHPQGVALVRTLAERADGLIEGFRPGVMERLGLGPEECLASNPRLVYGRASGWGQDGPYRLRAGHDINYIAIAGALALIGHAGGPPVPPVALVGDYGGGAMFLLAGMLAGVVEASRSGHGQVVDCAVVEGAAMLTASVHARRAAGTWLDGRGMNKNDTGSHFYNVYACADGEYVAIGALEPHFYAELLRVLDLADDPDFQGQWDQSRWPASDPELAAKADRTRWPELQARLAALFRTQTRAEWCARFAGVDTCFAPVLSPAEAMEDPHLVARQSFVEVAGVPQPAPAPRFSRTPSTVAGPPAAAGQHTDQVLADAGFTTEEIAELRRHGAAH